MTWDIQDALKWMIVFTGSFIVIVTLYTLFIRRIEFLRFLFGMKTTHYRFDAFRKRKALVILQVLSVGLIFFTAVNMGRNRSPMPLMYDSGKDILLNAESITGRSATGVRVVNDEGASGGQAIEFFSG
jgi:glucan biosynthesis protein C